MQRETQAMNGQTWSSISNPLIHHPHNTCPFFYLLEAKNDRNVWRREVPASNAVCHGLWELPVICVWTWPANGQRHVQLSKDQLRNITRRQCALA
jgi:hypothetical protein